MGSGTTPALLVWVAALDSKLSPCCHEAGFFDYHHLGGKSLAVLLTLSRFFLAKVMRQCQRDTVRKLSFTDAEGGTFPVTSLGKIGRTAFTPIINAPEVAIIGISRARLKPVEHESKVALRLMLPLSLPYDHRVIDGAKAARFMGFVRDQLQSPDVLLS